MQREEKQQDAVLEAIINKVNDLKNTIASMIYKVENEYETLNWPTFLDNFALISGQLTTLTKMLNNEKAPNLKSLTVLPLLLSPDRDEELTRLTEGRLTIFSHDVVPDYLRTKPEPDAESKMIQLEHKASCVPYDTAQKQVAAMNKVVSHVWEIITKAREDWESEVGARAGSAQTSLVADTSALVAAITTGKGLKHAQPPQGMMPQQRGPGGPLGPPQGPMPPQMAQMNKAPSTIKTNIKAGGQMHPYNR